MRRGLLTLALVVIGCGTSIIQPSSQDALRPEAKALDFGEVYAGETASLALQISNPSKHRQSVSLDLAAPFQSLPSLDISGGVSAPLLVSFRPTEEGAFEAALLIGDTPVALKGRGLAVLECRPPVNRCSTSTFDPGTGQCVIGDRPDGAACASVCMAGGTCSGGSCLGTLADCSDGNACTNDGCNDAKGCFHAPKACPGSPTNKCKIPSCDPILGCQLADAVDGTACGPRDCQTQTTRVCINAACVDRPLPTHECLNLFAYLKASNTEAGDSFGSRIAISADGSTLAVGTFVESSSAKGIDGPQHDNLAPHSGAVYVFRRITGAWVQEAYVKASNTDTNDAFGYSLALSADGSTLAVGAQLEDSNATGVNGDSSDNQAEESGAVYVYRRSGSSWAPEAYLKASNTEQGDAFGASLAMSGDGSTIAVGASGEDSNSTGLNGNQVNNAADEAGAVYVFRRGAGGWAQESYVKASTVQGGDQFGFAIALSTDGKVLAVSAPGEDSKATGINGSQTDNGVPQSGAVFVFRRAAGWMQEAYVKASNTGAGDAFGISLSLSANGQTLAVGAYGEDSSATGVNSPASDNASSQSGAAYVFRSAAAGWSQEAYVKASNTAPGDDFGFSVALSGNGNVLAVGAWSENSSATGVDGHQFNNGAPDSGAVYFFRRTMGWAQDAYLKASNTDASDVFGYSLAISGDGTTLAAAALGEDSSARGVNGVQGNNSADDSGAVYVFSTQ